MAIRFGARIFAGLLVLAILAVLSPRPVLAKTRTVKITLLLVCDVYDMKARGGRGGFARIAGAVKAERRRRKNLIVAHAGDTLSPSLMSGFDRGKHIIQLTNMVGLDLFVPGNHEYDFGEEVFRKRMAEAKFPILAANLRDKDGKPLAGIKDTMLRTFEGVKIGIVGLTAENSVSKSSPGTLTFRPGLATLKEKAGELRKAGADLIVAVAHAPWQDDVRMTRSGEIDVLLSGDDHNLVLFYDGKTAWAEAKEEGEYLVAVDLEVKLRTGKKRRSVRWWPRFRVIDTADVKPDRAVKRRVRGYQKLLSKELDVAIGRTETALDSRKALVRTRETAIGNLIADAMRAEFKADVAFMNGGGIRGNKQYAAGVTLTRRDILSELPFGNKLILVEMKGKDLKVVLENGLWYAGKANGRFLHVSGARIVAEKSKIPGQRITSLTIAGAPLDPEKTYRVATNDFIARGKEGYGAFARARVIFGARDGRLVTNAVMAYIRKSGAVSPKVEGRIVLK